MVPFVPEWSEVYRKREKNVIEQPYEPPAVIDLGELVEFTLGTGAADTADMNTARYY